MTSARPAGVEREPSLSNRMVQPNFWGIFDLKASRDARLRRWLLRRAAIAEGFAWSAVDIQSVRFSALPQPRPGDVVFGFTRNTNHVERLLLRPWVGTCYESFEAGLRFPDATVWTTIHAAHGISMPVTIHGLKTDDQELKAVADALGGFPVVVKEEGLSQGRGVKLARHHDQLRLAAASQRTPGVTIVREYVDTNMSTRVVVVGSEVVFSYRYQASPGDFRSNAGLLPSVATCNCEDAARHTALKAVHALGLTCGGVDLLQDRNGRWLLLEVNFPFNFATPDLVLKASVARTLVRALAREAAQRQHCR
jgi:hypothetical protein